MKHKIGGGNDALAEAERELTRLRAEVENLRVGKLPTVQVTGPPGTYRVILPGLRPLLCEVTIRPRYPNGFIPRMVGPGAVVEEKYRTLPEVAYDGLALFPETGS